MLEHDVKLFQPVCNMAMESAVLDTLRSGQIASGSSVSQLESAMVKITGRKHLVSTSDLSSAITIALYMAGVRPGDSVATLAFSCLQSNAPISTLGAFPVWIDIDPKSMSMSVSDLESKLDATVKAVMVYHVAGYPADIVKIAEVCKKRRIPLIEDCNAAIGACLNDAPVGLHGDFSVYSLYPTRQINGIDGGILATPDARTAERARRLRRFGIDALSFRDQRGEINANSDVPEIGWSAALNNVNASVALAQLDTLNDRLKESKSVAKKISHRLASITGVNVVSPVKNSVPSGWVLLLESELRDDLLMHLKRNKIGASILHQRNDIYTGFSSKQTHLIGTTYVMKSTFAIPCGWWVSDSQIEYLTDVISDFMVKI